ncbi:uncharacterized protein [Mytilus edulis]|uniref:uncharacterized protein n=1 Tax=Mytilus edulis TaxID=6550 RepID=UPI0039EE9729
MPIMKSIYKWYAFYISTRNFPITQISTTSDKGSIKTYVLPKKRITPKVHEITGIKAEGSKMFCHDKEAKDRRKIAKLIILKQTADNAMAKNKKDKLKNNSTGESFRPEFMKLGGLFETAGHLALTSSATQKALKELEVILNYRDTTLIISNPDRPNIYLEIRRRLPNIQKVDKLDELIKPIADQLCEQQSDFPLTVIYVANLESLVYHFRYLEYELKENGYNGINIPKNTLFVQYHSDYPETMKQHIAKDLCQRKPILRLVLATVALSMGLNTLSIKIIIHCRPPTTLEK